MTRAIESMQTRASLVASLRGLGLEAGADVIVHSALSRVGFISGGAVAYLQALLEVLGPTGTLMMPTHTPDLTEPSRWENPPVDSRLWQRLRDTMPAFDPARTPCRFMGMAAETFRTWPGVRRSNHPQVSFAAIGPRAAAFLDGHPLTPGFGEGSPIERLASAGGSVLLVGCGYESCTMLHLSEHRSERSRRHRVMEGAPMLVDGRRTWVEFEDVRVDAAPFAAIGASFEAIYPEHVSVGRLGHAECRLVRAEPLVTFGLDWFDRGD